MARLQQKKQAAVTTGSAKSSGLPCAMVLRLLRALPGDHCLVATVVRERFRGLSACFGAPGPHDFAVRVSIVRPRDMHALDATRVHRIPHPRFVTIGRNAPLHRGGTVRMMLVIWVNRQKHRPATDWHDGQFSHGAYARTARRAKSAGERLVLLPAPRVAVGARRAMLALRGRGWLRKLLLSFGHRTCRDTPRPLPAPRAARGGRG